jgi:hypothetical protein
VASLLLCPLLVQIAELTDETPDTAVLEQQAATTRQFYLEALAALAKAGVPHLLGGGYAFMHYTGIYRDTKDLDIFMRPRDAERAVAMVAQAGYRAEIVAPHWLGKAHCGDAFIDFIFSSGNGVCLVDDEWFVHAERASVLGVPVLLSPVEEMVWSKAFVLERERFDGADIGHLLRARGAELDWARLLRRFEPHWHVLLSHLVLFRFSYPSERALVPRWVMRELLDRLDRELDSVPPDQPICRGTLLSARQYLPDVEQFGFRDARLDPTVRMTEADIALLTRSLRQEEARGRDKAGRGR